MRQNLSSSIMRISFLTTLVLLFVMSACDKDKDPGMPPNVNITDPLNNATGVALDNRISATFNVPMNTSTVSKFSLKHGSTDVAGVPAYSGKTASFNPAAPLLPNTIYTATITKSAISQTGTSMLSDYIWSFTTGAQPDLAKPTATLTDPVHNATGIPRNQSIKFTFSETMDQSTINASTFTLKDGTTVIAGAIQTSELTATYTPTAPLSPNTVYVATITTGAKDLAGNALALSHEVSFTTSGAVSGQSAVNLGAAGDYVILAKTAVNNNPGSAITGDIALSPAATSYITGFALTDATGYATSSQVTGKVYAADMASPTPVNLTTAVENMITAYNDAAGRLSPDFLELATGNIGGRTLTPGLYKWTNTVTLPADVIIAGGASDVWIFQIAGDLTMSSAIDITLEGGAQAKNIFWQVAGTVTMGTTSHFEGVILSMTGVTFQTGASLNGRALAQTAVVLDANTIVQP